MSDTSRKSIFIHSGSPEPQRRAEKVFEIPSFLDDDFSQHDVEEETEAVMSFESDPTTTYGSKTIGTYSSYVFIINQIFGPGVLALPIVFQQGSSPLSVHKPKTVLTDDIRLNFSGLGVHSCKFSYIYGGVLFFEYAAMRGNTPHSWQPQFRTTL